MNEPCPRVGLHNCGGVWVNHDRPTERQMLIALLEVHACEPCPDPQMGEYLRVEVIPRLRAMPPPRRPDRGARDGDSAPA